MQSSWHVAVKKWFVRYVISELDWMREFIEGVSMEAVGSQTAESFPSYLPKDW